MMNSGYSAVMYGSYSSGLYRATSTDKLAQTGGSKAFKTHTVHRFENNSHFQKLIDCVCVLCHNGDPLVAFCQILSSTKKLDMIGGIVLGGWT